MAAGFAQLRGVAASRGHWGVDLLIARTQTRAPWPDTPKARAWARRRVADLTGDERLLELLAAEVTRYAAKRWVSAVTPAVVARPAAVAADQ